MDRRIFLTQVVPAMTAAAFAARTLARSPEGTSVTPLATGMWLLSGYGGNVTVFDSPEGVLLVDGGAGPQSAQLLRAVGELAGKPAVHTLFNTHWHHDQTGSNAALGEAGTRIIAHENTRLWLGTEVDSDWEQRRYTRLPEKARPNQTFYTTGTLAFGGERIDYGHLPMAHTDGDIYVYFHEANVLVAGDVVAVETYPVLDYASNGWITGMINGLKALEGIGNEATKIIPGRGAVATRAQVAEQAAMLITVRERFARLIAQGRSLEEVKATNPTAEFDAKWGDPSLFLGNVWTGMVRRPQELGQNVV